MTFKAGQKIRVIRKATEQEENDYKCTWISPEMDNAIGKIGIVKLVVHLNNVVIDFENNTNGISMWTYPNPCVKLLEGQLMFDFMYDR